MLWALGSQLQIGNVVVHGLSFAEKLSQGDERGTAAP